MEKILFDLKNIARFEQRLILVGDGFSPGNFEGQC
jgi:hypothetical protein